MKRSEMTTLNLIYVLHGKYCDDGVLPGRWHLDV